MKLTDRQKAQLKKHMDGHSGTPTEKRSHRMKMMTRMTKGMSLNAAHKDIMGTEKFIKKNTPAKVRRRGGYSNPVPSAALEEAFSNSRDATRRNTEMVRTDDNNRVLAVNGVDIRRNARLAQDTQNRINQLRENPNARINTTDGRRYYFLRGNQGITDDRRQDYLHNAREIAAGRASPRSFYDRPVGQRVRVPTPPGGRRGGADGGQIG
jgi:hypothetical protein